MPSGASAVNASSGDIASNHLFGTFVEIATKRLGNHNPPKTDDVETLFREIHHYATTWRDLRTATYSTARGRFMSRLADLATSTPMPLVVWMAAQTRATPQTVTDKQFETALNVVESYLVRRAALGLTPKNYNRIFATLLGSLERSKSADVGALLASNLRAYAEETNVWPSDDDFSAALTTENQYQKNLKTRRVRMVLEAIEVHLLGPDVEQLAPPGVSSNPSATPAGEAKAASGQKFTVEHVLPQTWRPNWPLPADADENAGDVRDAARHLLGNLTLVTGSSNSVLSNKAWPTKRSYLATRSLLLITQAHLLAQPRGPGDKREYTQDEQVADRDFSSLWETDPVKAIATRGAVLAAWALEIWPR